MLLCKQVPNFDDPGKIIHCLVNNLSNIDWGKLDADQAATLLKYFSDRVENLGYKEISKLKSIPVFQTPSKELTSIDTCCKVVVKPDEIPVSGLDIIAKESNVMLLRDLIVPDLFRLLYISYLSTERIYLELIFPHQSCLSRDQFFEHIDYLCKHVFGPDDKVENNKILKRLFDLSFIKVGLPVFVRVKDTFYEDPKRQPKVFNLFCKKHEILPTVYQKPHIIEVFKNELGLQCDMTIELFERFASDIANTQCHYGTSAKEKAALLVKILFRKGEKFRHINDFTRLSTIPFIFPTPLDHLSTIYKQFNSQRAFCFANSVLFEKQNTCWTSANILPMWADPRSYNAHELLSKLRIRMEPSEDQLFAHCKHIGNALKDGLPCFKDERDKITEVMECVYEALSESSAHIRNFNDLKTIPIIYFPKRNITKLPVSVITECSMDEEIEPYLQKMPKEYGKFESLFLKLGASKEPSVLQYVDVIETIRRESSMNVTQEQKDAILKAMSNIFKFLKKLTSPTLWIHSLYMLSDTYMLTEAKKLVICNNRYLQKRLQKGMNMTYMANIEQPGIDSIVDSLQMLPDYCRPLLLTDTVKEEVDIGSVTYLNSDIANKFENFIHNQLFVTSVCRLARHGIRNKLSGEWNVDIEKDITELVLNIELKHVENICTHLFLNGQMIEKTSETKSVYTHVMGKRTIVYFDTGNTKWSSDVSNEIILRLKGCHACLEDKLLFTAQKIFMCNDPDLCEEILDKEGIEAYNGLNGPTTECKNTKAEIEKKPYQLYPEAKKWQRQAHCDLDNARECLSVLQSDAYNWICYKTHQVSTCQLVV
jgi:sacsin